METNFACQREDLCSQFGRVYFLGLGGSGMYGAVRLAAQLGLSVCGTDTKEGKNTSRLRALGIPVLSENEPIPKDVHTVVYSLAVSPSHPLLLAARARGLNVLERAAFLGRVMTVFPVRAAVAGSHGKSSTTAMCAEILRIAGVSATVLCGAELDESEGGFRAGNGEVLLLEACEYRDAFLSLSPTHALALGVSWEHTDYFPSRESVLCSFEKFLRGESVLRTAARADHFAADVTYGRGGDLTAEEVVSTEEGSRFFLSYRAERLGEVRLGVLGRFQVENALGAAALALSLGIGAEDIVRGLCAYRGIPRRMEQRGSLRGVPLYLDFAHHPKELLCALRTAAAFGRPLAVVFEPHTYSRTKSFFDEYVRALRQPHIAGVLPVYASRETDPLGVSSVMLAKAAGVAFLSDYVHAARFLTRAAGKGCTLLLVGAGGVEEVLSHLPLLM